MRDPELLSPVDLETPLAERREALEGIVVHARLGSMLAKANRVQRLACEIGLLLQLPEATLMAAASGAYLAKCDLASETVRAHPELRGEVGRACALAQGVSPEVADVISTHHAPRSAEDGVSPTDAGALVAIADRLDTLVGFFGIGLDPKGDADPFELGRARDDVRRTMERRGFDLRLAEALRAAYDGFAGDLDAPREETVRRLGAFFDERAG